ncbi:MAG: chemotaxis protein CheW [Janthinobacterium lividum]
MSADLKSRDSGEHVSLVVSLHVGGQLCGLPVGAVRDVLGPQRITRVPLASAEIAGNLNLRGRIVTTIDLRKRLGLQVLEPDAPCMSLVTEHGQELYALLVDRVLEVVSVPTAGLAALPPNLTSSWSRFGTGVHRFSDGLMIMLDITKVLAFMPKAA